MSGVFPTGQNTGFTNPMQNQFNFQQQFYNSYLQHCQMYRLNPQDQNNYNQFCQMWMMNNQMMMQMSQFNPMNFNNNANNIPVNVGGNLNNNNINNNPQPIPQTTSQPAVYINDNDKPKEIMPRKEETLYVKPNELQGKNIPPQMLNQNFNQFQAFAGMGGDIINVTLNATTGFKVVIPAPKTMTFEELFITFANKAGVPTSTIGEQIVFLYNAEKLDAKSKQPISSMFKSFNANITVLDQGGIIGA